MRQTSKPASRKPTRANILPAAVLRSLSIELQADPRTIAKVLRGEPVRGMAGVRVQAGLARILEAVAQHGSGLEPKP